MVMDRKVLMLNLKTTVVIIIITALQILSYRILKQDENSSAAISHFITNCLKPDLIHNQTGRNLNCIYYTAT